MKDIPIGNFFAVNVQTTDTIVLPAANRRRSLILVNSSGQNMFISLGVPAIASTTFRLVSNGQPVYLHREEIGNIIDADLHAICGAAPGFISGFVSYDP